MSDSSEDEDLSRFKESVDISFVKLINESRGIVTKESISNGNQKSERYLETSSHYNDVRVPEEMQKRIGMKISAIIEKNVEFVTLENKVKKRKIKGGVKLFRSSNTFLSCDEVKDTSTEIHNKQSKKLKIMKKKNYPDTDIQNEEDKIRSVTVTGQYIMSKEATKCWKSRRKEKLFKYKSNGEGTVLTAVE